jgi:phosphatidylethanolamine-binding protein (PEBP) family uncharacterized protein
LADRALSALVGLGLGLLPSLALAEMSVALLPPWDGQTVPAAEICTLQGGNGSTPPMALSGLPEGTASVAVEYNDISFAPMAFNGGHGVIGFAVSGAEVDLAPVPAMTADLPEGSWVVSAARAGGQYASPGYIPPCSGGNGHTYQAVVRALDANGVELDMARVVLGKY